MPDDDLSRPIGRPHEHHGTIDSTNARAGAWLRDGAPSGAVVTAEAQSAGRGRMGRVWSSEPAGDLYASVVWRPEPPEVAGTDLGALGLAVGVALRRAVRGATREAGGSVAVDLKWPNDLLVGGRKLGGILIETRWVGDRPQVVIGFGINVGRVAFTAPLDAIATSLARECGESRPGRRAVLVAAVTELDAVLDRFVRAGFASVRDEYEDACVTLGRPVLVPRVQADGSAHPVHGVARRLDDDGALVVAPRGGGPEFRVASGDVVHHGARDGGVEP